MSFNARDVRRGIKYLPVYPNFKLALTVPVYSVVSVILSKEDKDITSMTQLLINSRPELVNIQAVIRAIPKLG